MLFRRALGAALLLSAAAAQAQTLPEGTPALDPRAWHSEIAGRPTQMLTIGSTHLSGWPSPLSGTMLEPLIERLIAFHPDVVTIENLSGEECAVLRATPALYDNAAESYCWDADAAQRSTGQTLASARMAIAQQLKDWPAVPSPAQRRQLASLFLAANERSSALVQWLQLPAAEQHAGEGVDATALDLLTSLRGRMNESYAIAAVVAARLGLQRVMPVDNHTADAVQADMPATCSDAITRMWQSPTAAALQADDHAAIAAVRDGQGMLAYYQSINRPERLRRYIDVDQRAAVGGGGAGECGRRYLAWWETRNLHMVANIRAASGAKPGARVLNIVGASHKPYYDQYLAMMSDVVLVDAEQVLR